MNFLKFKLFFLFFLSCTLLCAQSELEKRLKEPPKEYDFAQITLQEFNSGKEESINFLGISTHEINYFLPLSYAYKGKYPKYKRNEAKFQISVKKHRRILCCAQAPRNYNLFRRNLTWHGGYG